MMTPLLNPSFLKVLFSAEDGTLAAKSEIRRLAFSGAFPTRDKRDKPADAGSSSTHLPDTWRVVELGDVLDVQNGYAFKSAHFNDHGEGLPIIRIRDIFNTDTEAYYSGDYRDEFLVDPGDLIIGMDGNFNVAEWAGPVALLNQRVCRLQNLPEYLEPRFLLHGIQEHLDEIHRNTSYTTVKHLSAKKVKAIEFPLPPVAEQRRIITLLESLFRTCDDLQRKIEQRDSTRSRLISSIMGTM